MPLFGPFAQPGGLFGRRFARDDFLDPEDLSAYRDFLRRAGGPGPASGGPPPPPPPDEWLPRDLWPSGPKGGSGAPPPPPVFPLLGAPTTVRRQLFGPLANLPPLR